MYVCMYVCIGKTVITLTENCPHTYCLKNTKIVLIFAICSAENVNKFDVCAGNLIFSFSFRFRRNNISLCFAGFSKAYSIKIIKKVDILKFFFLLLFLNSVTLFIYLIFMNFVFFYKNDFNYKPKKLSSLIICFNCLYIIF